MRILGVDYGDARTGIAVCDEGEKLASPVAVLKEWNAERLAGRIAELAAERRARAIVVGLPRNMDGSCGPRAEKSKAFAALLERTARLPVAMWDERCTTLSAGVYLSATGTHGKKRKAVIDAAAATLILQDYLDYRRSTGADLPGGPDGTGGAGSGGTGGADAEDGCGGEGGAGE